MHAAVQAHYFRGGYYPRGGAASIPRAFIKALRKAGGAIRVRAPVSKILVEGGRAIGVRLADGTEIRAHAVVSNADPDVTLRRLVGVEHLSRTERWRLSRMRWSVSAISLFCATDLDLRALGHRFGQLLVLPRRRRRGHVPPGPDALEARRGPRSPGGFLTATTLKDPSKSYGGKHTLESFAFVGYDAFARVGRARSTAEPARELRGLQARAARVACSELAGRVVPGLESHVAFAELGTPLSNVHYCASTRGNLYGTEKIL